MLFCLVVLLLHISTSSYEYSRYNLEWNGTSIFFNSAISAGAGEIRESAQLTGKERSILLIIAPEGTFTGEEIADIFEFIARGNIVVLADESGSGNNLLEGLESEIRIIPANITSIDRYYDDSSSVIAYPSSRDPLNAGTDSLILNRPAYVRGGQPVFSTSILTWIDGNGNGRIDEMEELGIYSIISREDIGNGILYVLADPSIFINGMHSREIGDRNQPFIDIFLQNDSFSLLLEQGRSRTATADAHVRGIIFVKSSSLLKILLFTVIGAIASLIVWKRYMGVT